MGFGFYRITVNFDDGDVVYYFGTGSYTSVPQEAYKFDTWEEAKKRLEDLETKLSQPRDFTIFIEAVGVKADSYEKAWDRAMRGI